jgi:hypothetical protein
MLRLLFIVLSFVYCNLIYGQQKSLVINRHQFVIIPKKVKNEWGSFDHVRTLYRVEGKAKNYVLKYYHYKDEGKDCNNVYWNRSSYKIQRDSIIFITHYFQKTGLDPIPEWHKQIYRVKKNGILLLLFGKYKYYHKTEWTNNIHYDPAI